MKRKPAKYSTMRFRKNDHAYNLQAAVTRWVKSVGGRLVVVGGIEVQTWPTDRPYNFRVAVHCTGRKPVAKSKEFVRLA